MNKPYADEAPMRRVAPLLIVLLVTLAIILAAVAVLDRQWGPEGNQALPHGGQQAVAPALETAPQPELLEYLAQKQRLAQGYAWIDATRHLARIPIDEAMRALAASSTGPSGARAAYLMGADVPANEEHAKEAGHERPPRNDERPAGADRKSEP